MLTPTAAPPIELSVAAAVLLETLTLVTPVAADRFKAVTPVARKLMTSMLFRPGVAPAPFNVTLRVSVPPAPDKESMLCKVSTKVVPSAAMVTSAVKVSLSAPPVNAAPVFEPEVSVKCLLP